MWSIFEELRERRAGGENGELESFEKNREDVEMAMNVTVSEGSSLVAKLKHSDPFAEQHILDLVHSIQQAKARI